MKIHKKIFSLFLAITLLFSSTVTTFASSVEDTNGDHQLTLWDVYLASPTASFADYITAFQFTNQWASGNDVTSPVFTTGSVLTTPKKYYSDNTDITPDVPDTPADKNNVESVYNAGTSSYTSIVNQTYNTTTNNYNLTYNHINNNTYTTYQLTEINYNQEFNTYEFVTNETNYYITYSPTYVTVMYYDESTSQSIKNDYYYQLPDGRNSYDLTASDVWGTYFIYNFVNYDEVVEDDGYTKYLFHFDGDLKNSAATNIDYSPTVSVPSFQDGRFGSALIQKVVDGSERFLKTGSVYGSCVEFWVYFSSLCYDSSGKVSSFSNVYPNFLYNGDNSNSLFYSIPTDTWTHIAIQYNPNITSEYDWELFVNGKFIGTTQWYYPSNYIRSQSNGIGAYYSSVFGIDEYRILANKRPYTSDGFTPQLQPFDTNLVLVLPENGTENDIAVKSNIAVSNMRVGGVRPTIPTNGSVYVYLEDNIVKDIQQYQTDGWYSVDASIYEDNTWVALKNKDLSEYTISEDDFNDTNTDNDNSGNNSGNNSGSTDSDNDSTGLLSSIMDKITGFFTGLLDIFFGGILDLITVITDNLTGIIDGFTGITSFLGSLFGFLPEQMVSVLTSGLAVIIVVIIIKIFI